MCEWPPRKIRKTRIALASLISVAVGALGSALAAVWGNEAIAWVAPIDEPRLAAIVAAAVALAAAGVALACICCKSAQRAPFGWSVLHEECGGEFIISGPWQEVVEKRGDYKMAGWVIPVNGTLQMKVGNVYRWALAMEQVNRARPEIQFGIQGVSFDHPWRLITTTRCSRSRDEEEFFSRTPGGDRRIKERDVIHLHLDLRRKPGGLSMAVNDEPFEVVFNDIPTDRPVVPVLMLGGHGSRVRVQASERPAQLFAPTCRAGSGSMDF